MNQRRSKKAQRRLSELYTDNARLVTALLRAGADPNLPDAEGVTPLYRASVQGNARNVRVLLQAGARPNDECSEGLPLCAAACWAHDDTVKLLLAAAANPHLREQGEVCEHCERRADPEPGAPSTTTSQLPGRHLPDRHLPDQHLPGLTAVEWASRNGHETTAKLLQ